MQNFIPLRVTGSRITVNIAAAMNTPRASDIDITQPENTVESIAPMLLNVVDQPNTAPRLRCGVAAERIFVFI